MKPRMLFLAAATLAAVVIVAALEVRSPECSQRSPHWFVVLFFICGPLSVLAAFTAIFAYTHRRGAHPVGSLLAGLGVAALWTFIGLFILLEILLPSGCLS